MMFSLEGFLVRLKGVALEGKTGFPEGKMKIFAKHANAPP